MARISIYLPDDFYETVVAARLPVSAICRQALEDALRHGGTRPDIVADDATVLTLPDREDEEALHSRGRAFGARWAATAPPAEVDAVLIWSRVRWRSFSLDPARHSLPYAHAREAGLPIPEAGRRYWLERNAFSAGMLEGIAEAVLHHSAV